MIDVILKFFGVVKNGRVHLDSIDEYNTYIQGFKDNSQVEVIVKRKRKKRSTGQSDEQGNQNGWYWGCILPICAKELGYDVEELHENFIQLYAPYRIITFMGKQIHQKIRTHQMNTIQFAEYCETIRRVMADQGILIPDPKKVHYE